jgi:hypothetical protein
MRRTASGRRRSESSTMPGCPAGLGGSGPDSAQGRHAGSPGVRPARRDRPRKCANRRGRAGSPYLPGGDVPPPVVPLLTGDRGQGRPMNPSRRTVPRGSAGGGVQSAVDRVTCLFEAGLMSSLPDLSFPDTSVEDWQVLIDLIDESSWRVVYCEGDTCCPAPRSHHRHPRGGLGEPWPHRSAAD